MTTPREYPRIKLLRGLALTIGTGMVAFAMMMAAMGMREAYQYYGGDSTLVEWGFTCFIAGVVIIQFSWLPTRQN